MAIDEHSAASTQLVQPGEIIKRGKANWHTDKELQIDHYRMDFWFAETRNAAQNVLFLQRFW